MLDIVDPMAFMAVDMICEPEYFMTVKVEILRKLLNLMAKILQHDDNLESFSRKHISLLSITQINQENYLKEFSDRPRNEVFLKIKVRSEGILESRLNLLHARVESFENIQGLGFKTRRTKRVDKKLDLNTKTQMVQEFLWKKSLDSYIEWDKRSFKLLNCWWTKLFMSNFWTFGYYKYKTTTSGQDRIRWLREGLKSYVTRVINWKMDPGKPEDRELWGRYFKPKILNQKSPIDSTWFGSLKQFIMATNVEDIRIRRKRRRRRERGINGISSLEYSTKEFCYSERIIQRRCIAERGRIS